MVQHRQDGTTPVPIEQYKLLPSETLTSHVPNSGVLTVLLSRLISATLLPIHHTTNANPKTRKHKPTFPNSNDKHKDHRRELSRAMVAKQAVAKRGECVVGERCQRRRRGRRSRGWLSRSALWCSELENQQHSQSQPLPQRQSQNPKACPRSLAPQPASASAQPKADNAPSPGVSVGPPCVSRGGENLGVCATNQPTNYHNPGFTSRLQNIPAGIDSKATSSSSRAPPPARSPLLLQGEGLVRSLSLGRISMLA